MRYLTMFSGAVFIVIMFAIYYIAVLRSRRLVTTSPTIDSLAPMAGSCWARAAMHMTRLLAST